jgi:S1-C subfamily serine protease
MRRLSAAVAVLFMFAMVGSALARDDEKQPATKPAAPRGWLGCKLAPNEDGAGIVIMEVIDKSPAAAAGLKEEDVITKIDGKTIEDIQGFVTRMRQTKPGDELKLTITREKEEKEVSVKLGDVPKDMQTPEEPPKKD